jgi:hypothetical protein
VAADEFAGDVNAGDVNALLIPEEEEEDAPAALCAPGVWVPGRAWPGVCPGVCAAPWDE